MTSLKVAEITAVVLTLGGIVGATAAPFYYEAASVEKRIPPERQVITLTGVGHDGVWTDEEVTGANYWKRSFRPGRPALAVGKPALLRLKSADVVHTFYLPALGIGPVEVYPGHVAEVAFTAQEEGVFEYYCRTVCGTPHFNMRGVVIVGSNDPEATAGRPPERVEYWREPPPREDAGLVRRGEWMFRQKGCITCHGPAGQGGVPNLNYVKDTVPALNTLAQTMFLFSPEDVNFVVERLEQRVPLKSLEEDAPVGRFSVVLAQYESIRNVIRRGNPAGKKDPNGPAPPLEMPAWESRLSDADIDAIIAYLLTQQRRDAAED
jgi:mono/diheme cytochrome c family protein